MVKRGWEGGRKGGGGGEGGRAKPSFEYPTMFSNVFFTSLVKSSTSVCLKLQSCREGGGL